VVTGERIGTAAASRGDSDTFTYGLRLNGKLPAKFDYTLESMLQRGTFAADPVRAYAFHSRLGYSIAESFWKPKLLLEYNQGSGDRNPNDGVRGTYDQLFPDNHQKYGIHDTIGLRNTQNLRLGMGFTPSKKTKLDVDYHNFWLTQVRDGLYNEQGTLVSRSLTGTAGKHIGSEADMQLIYNLKSFVQLGAVYSYFFAGTYLKSTTPGAPQTSTYTYVTYKF
jgi:hypothetical protein